MRTHRQIDRLNLALGRATADKLRRQPELFDKVVGEQLRRWRARVENGDVSTRPYLERWERLAARGLEPCLDQVSEDSEAAAAMRQAAPFAGVLTASERMQAIRAWRATDEARRP